MATFGGQLGLLLSASGRHTISGVDGLEKSAQPQRRRCHVKSHWEWREFPFAFQRNWGWQPKNWKASPWLTPATPRLWQHDSDKIRSSLLLLKGADVERILVTSRVIWEGLCQQDPTRRRWHKSGNISHTSVTRCHIVRSKMVSSQLSCLIDVMSNKYFCSS